MPDEVLSTVWSVFEGGLRDVLTVLGMEVIPDSALLRMGAVDFFPILPELVMNTSRIRYVSAWRRGVSNVGCRWGVVVTGASEGVFFRSFAPNPTC